MRKQTRYTLVKLIHILKIDALVAGRYDAPYTDEAYDKRDKRVAFRCITYNEKVRQINALYEIMLYCADGK